MQSFCFSLIQILIAEKKLRIWSTVFSTYFAILYRFLIWKPILSQNLFK